MGFFSWTTADTKESIPNIYSNREVRTVYLLQPNRQQPLMESEYQGYGVFSGVDAYIWLGRMNCHTFGLDAQQLSDDELRTIGIGLECGRALRDTQTGEIWHVFHDYRNLLPGKFFPGNHMQPIPEIGISSNRARELGRFESISIPDVVKVEFPLKFSFDPTAVYEELPASEICPDQGYFYEDGEVV
jgi:hypothetical protein